ncbi:MAG: hypothetical protein P4L93_08235 [Coriobacteriia bacterium]|nr:hypothetical protein [Coriobacteriia bacterium]
MVDLKRSASVLGNRLIACNGACADVEHDAAAGIPPRCLFFQPRGTARGAVVVGLNPGRMGQAEQQYLLAREVTYSATVDYWREQLIRCDRYYRRMEQLIDVLRIHGSIWWTELAKCQSRPETKRLSEQTLRRCRRQFLGSELDAVPADWPVVAAGRQAFEATAYLLPDRAVLGVPHPTGSYGGWPLRDGSFPADLQEVADSWLASTEPLAVWLTSASSGRREPIR